MLYIGKSKSAVLVGEKARKVKKKQIRKKKRVRARDGWLDGWIDGREYDVENINEEARERFLLGSSSSLMAVGDGDV